MRVLMVTSEWPTPDKPQAVPFIVRQVDFVRRAGVNVDVFHFRGGQRVINYVNAWRHLQKKLWKDQYDLVHCQFGQGALLPWPKRLPLVVTFRGCELLGVKDAAGRITGRGKLLQRLCQVVATQADAVVLVSQHMRPLIPARVPVHIIPSGIDFDGLPCIPQADARRQINLPLDERLVLFVGNPRDPRKRFELANRSVEILNQKLPAKLVLGWNIPHRQVPLFMNACDAFVFTSSQEGSPNVVKEALACNLPIVSVAVADVPVRLRGIEGCEVCADERPETIAAALERVLRRGQRIRGREAALNLDESLLTEHLLRIYRSVVEGKKLQPVLV